MRKVVEKLSGEVERLKARKPKTSRTSSKPPSTDGPWTKRFSKKKPSGKKRGGQPGHKGVQRKPAPPEDVNQSNDVLLESCRKCSSRMVRTGATPLHHQVIDIPPVKPRIDEWLLHVSQCTGCGSTERASLPAGVHPSSFGPNLSALVVLLSGEYRMSRRNIQRYIADAHGVEISLGAISNIERRMTNGLEDAHTEALAAVQESPTKHLDETTWRQEGKLAWLWAAVGQTAVCFLIRDSRRAEVAKELIGEEPTGILISDRYAGYSFVGLDQRQVCLAHLLRDFQRMAEGEKELRWISDGLLLAMNDIFRLWHRHRSEDESERISRAELRRWSQPLRTRVLKLLDEGALNRGHETPAMCRGILRTEPSMWTFIHHEGIEPTNNVVERTVRPGVILRKTSLGSQSDRGSRFVERMQTASATLKLTGRSLRDFVLDVAHHVLAGAAAPALLK
ncbi:Transposase IS66 family protein [Planctomycetes bacterium Poly30]|uniref:Transposase IS66 family protein n=1 Tax=Saltatorellus ferox TaxID=2528018 RepID=A0A518EN87_9BACT|nr:Transposase IS66 family protein [Planctomycetes bacterium Poly30]